MGGVTCVFLARLKGISLPLAAIQAEKTGSDLRKQRNRSAIRGAIRDTDCRVAGIAVVSHSAIRDFGL